jgi:hypothetical protein
LGHYFTAPSMAALGPARDWRRGLAEHRGRDCVADHLAVKRPGCRRRRHLTGRRSAPGAAGAAKKPALWSQRRLAGSPSACRQLSCQRRPPRRCRRARAYTYCGDELRRRCQTGSRSGRWRQPTLSRQVHYLRGVDEPVPDDVAAQMTRHLGHKLIRRVVLGEVAMHVPAVGRG